MTNAPEWVDPPDPNAPPPAPPRVSERQLNIEMFSAAMASMRQAHTIAATALHALGEMGEAISHTSSRLTKVSEWITNTLDYFDYEIVKGEVTKTKAERVKAENHELS